MSSVPCTNCGALLLAGAKFCRMCGQPSLDSGSVSEATTRVFGTAERSGPTVAWNAQPTGPAYLQPGQASPLNAAATTSLQRPQTPTSRVPLLVLLTIIVALLSLGAGVWLKTRKAVTRIVQPPIAGAPATGIPPVPPAPPVFNEPPAAGQSVQTSELMYPGAETTMELRHDNSQTLGLRTTDPTEKVVDWYIEKLKPSERIINGGSDAVLRAGRTTVIISGRSGKTDVIIKQGAGQ